MMLGKKNNGNYFFLSVWPSTKWPVAYRLGITGTILFSSESVLDDNFQTVVLRRFEKRLRSQCLHFIQCFQLLFKITMNGIMMECSVSDRCFDITSDDDHGFHNFSWFLICILKKRSRYVNFHYFLNLLKKMTSFSQEVTVVGQV